MLVFTALIWGLAFVAQEAGMDYVGPFTFLAIRNLIGSIVLIPLILAMGTMRKKVPSKATEEYDKKMLLKAGLLCGIALFAGAACQQVGMYYGASAGKAGFITALYILTVPLLGLIVKKKVRPMIWSCIAIALVGLYFLCIPQGQGLGGMAMGDMIVLMSAVCFGVQILVIDYFSTKVESVKLASLQFFVCAAISGICMFIFETPTIENIKLAMGAILFAGVFSSGIAFTLQIVAQKYTIPTVASLIMSLEAVFAIIAGAVFLGTIPTGRETFGSCVMFAAILLAQLPEKKLSSSENCEKQAA